jgi:hypothetical protein
MIDAELEYRGSNRFYATLGTGTSALFLFLGLRAVVCCTTLAVTYLIFLGIQVKIEGIDMGRESQGRRAMHACPFSPWNKSDSVHLAQQVDTATAE